MTLDIENLSFLRGSFDLEVLDMKWIVIAGVLIAWFVMPALFSALGHKDAKDFQHGVKSVVRYDRR